MIVIALLFLICCNDFQHGADRLISKELLKKDFFILRKTLEEAHPGLYWYTSKPVFDIFFDSIGNTLDHDMSDLEFFKSLLPVIARVRCVHTNIRLPGGGAAFKMNKCLPFDFFVVADTVYIIRDYSQNNLEGARLLSVNNISADSMIRKMLAYIPSDGYNETYKYSVLNKGAFAEGFALFYGQPARFIIEVEDSSSKKKRTLTVTAGNPEKIASLTAAGKNNFMLDYPDPSTALLSINSFALETRKFKDSLYRIFGEIQKKNIKKLVIDLRQNGGGNNDNVPELFSYISDEPFLHLKKAETNAGKISFLNYSENSGAFNQKSGMPDRDGKILVNHRYKGTSYRKPSPELLFKANVIILTSGSTVSAASEFVALAHANRRATIIGEETGGCYYGATGGNYLKLRLPASHLEVSIPTIRIFTAVKEDFIKQPVGRGVIPDREIRRNVLDVLQHKDVVLQAALDL